MGRNRAKCAEYSPNDVRYINILDLEKFFLLLVCFLVLKEFSRSENTVLEYCDNEITEAINECDLDSIRKYDGILLSEKDFSNRILHILVSSL